MEPKFTGKKASRQPIRARPQTAVTEDPKMLLDLMRYHYWQQKNLTRPEAQSSTLSRPRSANLTKSKPTLKMSMEEKALKEKRYNYSQRTFTTSLRKSDPVSRINQLKAGWKSNKFLKSNTGGTKQGRKLNVIEREKRLKPKGIFADHNKLGY